MIHDKIPIQRSVILITSAKNPFLSCNFVYSQVPRIRKWTSFRSVQFSCSHVQLFETVWTAASQASLSFTNYWNLLKLRSVESVMPFNHLILWCPLLLPSVFPSIRVFSSESVLRIRWPQYWSFSFSISPSNEYSRLISFRMDLLDLLAVQGTLKSLLQHHSSKASILWHSLTVREIHKTIREISQNHNEILPHSC